MDRSQPKIFRHQSGLIQSVQAELDGVLEATIAVVEKVKSDPPPKESLHPVDPGLYKLTSADSDEHPGLIETVIFPKNRKKT
jgi:hypothetical protein